MENERCAKLVLNTSLFYPSSTGAPNTVGAMDPTMGYADAMRLNCTFTNLDWRQILGDMYDKYDEFNLVLVGATYMSTGGTPYGTASNGNSILIKAEGLDWSNQSYDVYKRSMTSQATILTCTTTAGALSMPVYSSTTFKRPAGNGIRDFSLRIYRALDETQGGGGDRPAAYLYTFKIYGVEKK